MRIRFLLLAVLLLPLVYSAETRTIAAGQNYTVEGNTYTVYPLASNASAVQKDGRESIMFLDECLEFSYTKACLESVSASASVFSETYTGPIVTATHEVEDSSSDLGDPMTGTVEFENSGESVARNVSYTITLPEGLQFRSGNKQTFSWSGTVRDTAAVTYYFTSVKNGSYTISGSFSYTNGSGIKVVTLTNRTHTVTVPFTVDIDYEPNATNSSQVNITVEKREAEDYTILIELTLPPEAEVSSKNRNTYERDNVLTRRSRENATENSLQAIYSFRTPPTANATLRITYDREDEDQQELLYTLNYTTVEDIEPSLAVGVNPLYANSSGTLFVTITGNRTGELWLRGLLNYTQAAGPGKHEFTVAPTNAGNHTLTVQFFSTNAYGTPHTAEGTVKIPVQSARLQPIADATPPPTSATPEPETSAEPPIAVETKSFPFKLLSIAAICLLVVIGFIVYNMRDPITKLERLTARVTKLRQEIQKRQGAATEKEILQLATLEEELELQLQKLQ